MKFKDKDYHETFPKIFKNYKLMKSTDFQIIIQLHKRIREMIQIDAYIIS